MTTDAKIIKARQMEERKRRNNVFRIWREVISFGRLFIYINWKISCSRCRQQIQILLSTHIRRRRRKMLWLNSLRDFRVCILPQRICKSVFHNETSLANKIEYTKRHSCCVSEGFRMGWGFLVFLVFFLTSNTHLNFIFYSSFSILELPLQCTLSSQNFLQFRK